MTDAAAPILRVSGLGFRYPHQASDALSHVDVNLFRGRAIGLLGPNGSGKSTLINLLVGILQIQEGAIDRTDGGQFTVAWVPQEYAFYPNLTCRENLELFADMLAIGPAEAQQRVSRAVDSCRLHDFLEQRANRCSGGVKRRLNLGIALLQEPDLLLLDEPTVGVDPETRAFLLGQVRDLIDRGTAVLYATHYMEEVTATCSHILLLDRGRVLASGSLDELLGSTESEHRFDDLEQLFTFHTRRSLND